MMRFCMRSTNVLAVSDIIHPVRQSSFSGKFLIGAANRRFFTSPIVDAPPSRVGPTIPSESAIDSAFCPGFCINTANASVPQGIRAHTDADLTRPPARWSSF